MEKLNVNKFESLRSTHSFAWVFYNKGLTKYNLDSNWIENFDNDFATRQYLSDDGRKLLNGSVLKRYIYKNTNNYKYIIKKDYRNNGEVLNLNIKLDIESIELHLYDKVGIIFINCEHYYKGKESDFIQTINYINDFGRRIEMPYLPTKIKIKVKNKEIDYYKTIIADEIGIEGLSTTNYQELLRNNNIRELENQANFLYELLGINRNSGLISETSEDRMYVHSLICDHKLSKHFETMNDDYTSKKVKLDETLYQLLYVDSGVVRCQNKQMRKVLLDSCIYKRWTDYGTIYSATENALICICDEGSTNHIDDSVKQPFISIYKYLVSACLAQRFSIKAYSIDYTLVSEKIRSKSLFAGVHHSDLSISFSIFKKQILIPEITTQQQGNELYRLMQENMFIREQLCELNEQIDLLDSVIEHNHNSKIDFVGLLLSVLEITDIIIGINNPELKKESVIKGFVLAIFIIYLLIYRNRRFK